MERGSQSIQRGRPVSGMDAAHANEYFELFLNATSLKHILGYYRGLIDNLHLKPNVFNSFYPKLRANLPSWRAKALWKKFDARASHKCYQKGQLAGHTRVLIIGGGPCGLRTAIEAQLLGAKVVLIEKRDRLSRNNVLHLWPFVIEDLRMLGAKKFFGKFCAGAIDHISIRQLQCVLLKVALLLGVEVHTEVGFEKLIEPNAAEKTGWRAEFKPSNHPVAQYEFDVIIGADGKRNTLQGFSRKEFRGKLAIAITANFINKKTEAEARVEEISGVAFIFNQKFFKELLEETRIDLENIVYYKDDTHYFVMTAKKASLLEKGVIKQDLSDTEKLLAPENVDREALQQYAIEAANFSTNYQMPSLEFAVNHYGQPDIAMFDFTSMYAAENASKIMERNGYRLLMVLVGDSLLEPFWPTGSGCARGFLSALDAAWAIRSWSIGSMTPLDVLAERESIYRLLAQTTPDNLNKDWKSYTLDPATRYPNLNRAVVMPRQIICLYDTDNPENIDKMKHNVVEKPIENAKKRRRGNVDNEILINWLNEQLSGHDELIIDDIGSVFKDGKILCALIHHYRPDLLDYNSVKDEEPARINQLAFDVLEKELGIPPIMTGEEITKTEDYLTVASYLTQIYDAFRGEIPHIKHPKLELPESNKRSDLSFKTFKTSNIQLTGAQTLRPLSRHKRHAELMSFNKQSHSVDKKTRKRRTLEKVGATVDHENKAPNLTSRPGAGQDEDLAARIKSLENKWRDPQPVEKKPKDLLRAIGKIETSDWNIKEIEKKILENKMGKPSKTYDKEKVPKWSKEQFLARQTKMEKQHYDRQNSAEAKFADIDKSIRALDQKLKEGTVRELGQNKVATITEKLVSKVSPEPKSVEKTTSKSPISLPKQGSEFCHFCSKKVYLMERLSAEGRFFHHSCFKCQYCYAQLRLGSYAFDRDGLYGYKFFCLHHFGMVGEVPPPKIIRKPSQRALKSSPDKKQLSGVAGVDLLDRVQTPERIEFSNLSTGNISSDQDESLSQMDEDEWTDKNFGASCAELGDSDDSSSFSDTDSDDEEAYDDALEEPVTREGTMKWAERWKNSYSRKRHDSDSNGCSSSDRSSYYENSSDDDESDTATEGEEEIRARELRKQEVRVEPPVVQTDTGTDTEIHSGESSTKSSSEIHNSATEISTDSEFAHDDPTPTREVPSIAFNDSNVTKTRGSGSGAPKRIQVTTGYLQKPTNKGKARKPDNIELKLKPLVPTSVAPIAKKPAPVFQPHIEGGYALNRTQSTGGIAAKVSLELKKKYLLGEAAAGNIQKSGSASTLDTKFKSFHTTISDCQKLLKPALEISTSMQTFCNKLNERHSPILSPEKSEIKVSTEPQRHIPENAEVSTVVLEEKTEDKTNADAFQNESEGRPRSPLHETSIIVPNIDWNKRDDHQSSDSLATSSSDREQPLTPSFKFENIPRVEIHSAKDEQEKNDFPLDSLCLEAIKQERKADDAPSMHSEVKSVTSEKKSLNQPKSLPALEVALLEIHNSLHVKNNEKENSENDNKSVKTSSGLSSPDSGAEQGTNALTETELSDWARDGVVSDDLEDNMFESNDSFEKQNKDNKFLVDVEKDTKDMKRTIITEAMNSLLSANLDIEFMDTGTESSSDDGVTDAHNGYILFKDEEDFAEDSLNPNINEILRRNDCDVRNTGYCVLEPKKNPLNTILDSFKLLKGKDREEDSLLVLETGTTTEENTCSDSTVKNITEISTNINAKTPIVEEKDFNAYKSTKNDNPVENTVEFQEHCQRLQSKIEFGNVKDSISVRKSRRKSKSSESPQKPDLIQEEKSSPAYQRKDINLSLIPTSRTPDILYKKEVIQKERDDNQRLIQEMVMNKMKAENKSLERKKRSKPVLSPNTSHDLLRSSTTILDGGKSNINLTPDVVPVVMPLQTQSSHTLQKTIREPAIRPLSIQCTSIKEANLDSSNLQQNFSMPDIHKQTDNRPTPKAPPRLQKINNEINRTAENLKVEARARAKLLSNKELGLSPEEKLQKLREKAKKAKENTFADPLIQDSIESLVVNTEKRNSFLYSNDTLNKKKNGAFCRSSSGDGVNANNFNVVTPFRTKSISEIARDILIAPTPEKDPKKVCKSDPNLLETNYSKPKRKGKDRERRKSITKMLSTFFSKKSPGTGGNSRGLFSKLSPKSKNLSKSCANLDPRNADLPVKKSTRRNSVSELDVRNIVTPPPIPPLPLNYVARATDESSDEECDWKKQGHGSCDTLDNSAVLEASTLSQTVRRSSKTSRKAARQAQLKRHRMAQEIQRKLEETEVKTRELEQRGVLVEKALRGEGNSDCCKDESELLQEWFDLMRDRTELRRFEKELMIRAQELELEDSHARLQHDLRDRLESNEQKTEEDVKAEESIIKEMMNIVSKRDSLISVIEEDRLRYSNEDRDLEEQMLAKGLRLTPIRRSFPDK